MLNLDVVSADPVASIPDVFEAAVTAAVADLRPTLQRDGGDIELIAIDGDMVVVDMKGSCVGCVLASVTLAGVRKKIMEAVGRPVRVVPLSATTIRRPL